MLPLSFQDALQGKTILIVDDEPDSLAVARILLEMARAKVLTGTNGDEGLKLATEHLPLFIISDLSMPVMSGWELLRKLKEQPRTKDIPVIALTAHAMTGDRQRAIEVGFHNYLTKPLRPETFVRDLLHVVLEIPGVAEELKIGG